MEVLLTKKFKVCCDQDLKMKVKLQIVDTNKTKWVLNDAMLHFNREALSAHAQKKKKEENGLKYKSVMSLY